MPALQDRPNNDSPNPLRNKKSNNPWDDYTLDDLLDLRQQLRLRTAWRDQDGNIILTNGKVTIDINADPSDLTQLDALTLYMQKRYPQR